LIDVGDDRFILMEYVEGRSLRDLFNLARSRGKSLSPDAVCWLLAEVADALHAVHHATDVEGRPLHVVHRDVTPENVMVGATGRPVLVDFGVAFSTLPGRVETSDSNQTWLGKLPYLAPEQARFGRVDGRADLFALGCILVEAFTGQPPFGNNDIITIHRINQVTPKWVDAVTGGVPPAVKAICHKLLQHAPDERYTHGHEVAAALRACLTKPFGESELLAEIAWLEGLLHRNNAEAKMELLPPEPGPPAPPPPPEAVAAPAPEQKSVPPPPPRRYQSPWVLVGVVLLACACTAGLTWFAARSGQPGMPTAGVAATTPPTQPAPPPAPAPPEATREKLQAPEVQNVEGSSNVKANPPPATPAEATFPSMRGGGEEEKEEAHPRAVLCQGRHDRLLVRASCVPR
jgi:serine/threonine-protein kinase